MVLRQLLFRHLLFHFFKTSQITLLFRHLLFKTNAIQDICYSDICYFDICSSVFTKFFLYLFTSFPCKLCLNKSTIETYLKQVPADVATCWAKGYSLVVLYVFCQLGFRQNDCVTFVSCTNTLLNLLLTNLHHICLVCFKLAKSHCYRFQYRKSVNNRLELVLLLGKRLIAKNFFSKKSRFSLSRI